MTDYFARHRPTLDQALDACARRHSWTAYPESPSSKIHGEEKPRAGRARFEALLGTDYPLSQPGEIGRREPQALAHRDEALGDEASLLNGWFDRRRRLRLERFLLERRHLALQCLRSSLQARDFPLMLHHRFAHALELRAELAPGDSGDFFLEDLGDVGHLGACDGWVFDCARARPTGRVCARPRCQILIGKRGGRAVLVDQIIRGPLCNGSWSGTVYVSCDVQVLPWEELPTFLEDCDLEIAPDTVVYVAYHGDVPYYNGCSCHTGEIAEP